MTARRLVLALLFALVGAGTFTFWISRNMSKHDAPPPPKQQYVAATKPLDAGETLQLSYGAGVLKRGPDGVDVVKTLRF